MIPLNNVFEILQINNDKLKQFKEMSIEDYFHNNQFSIDAFRKKYSSNENYYQCIFRVCDYIASAEKTQELKEYWRDRWVAEILYDYWQPGGSIIAGAGNPKKVSMMNCTTIALNEDSLESIFRQAAYKVARTASYRQGLGVDYSKLRPKDSVVNNSSNFSNGACSWMKFIDSISYFVGQKGRIPAQLMSLSCKHPDLEEFIQLKSNYSFIQNANISTQLFNDFYTAVINNKDWEMEFVVDEIKIGDKIYINDFYDDINLADGKDENGYYKIAKFHRKKEIIKKKKNAKELLMLIAKNMMYFAEPGIQNIDIAKKYSNSDAVGFPIISTNACSEQYLDEDGNCCLASSNCSRFFDKNNLINEEKLELISESMVRFLDNVIEKELDDNRFATHKQKISLESLRRIGAGFTNIVGLLIHHNLSYGEKEANKLIEKFSERQNYYLYKNSIKLGKEKGSFKAFDKEKYLKSKFIQSMIERFPDLDFDNMRNVCVSSIAPTGCTIKETIIQTNKGLKSFKEIFEENNINIKDLEKQNEKKWFNLKEKLYAKDINGNYNEITKLYFNGNSNISILKFNDDSQFSATLNHKVLILDKTKEFGIWKRLDELIEGDEIIFE